MEKPFGHDLATASELNRKLQEVFPEKAIYRIDHYLGKETVQNVLAFRFGNGIFEPLWNRRYVNHVQITAAESIGVEGRGGYYQEAGALRDMIQNHLLQVMSTIAMEPPAVFEPDVVRDERAKVLRSIRIRSPRRRQSTASPASMGPRASAARMCPAFDRKKASIRIRRPTPTRPRRSSSTTGAGPTYRFTSAAANALPKRVTDIAIFFNPAPTRPSGAVDDGCATDRAQSADPPHSAGEGISLRFLSKHPGEGMRLRPVSMDFNYGTSFGDPLASAYETLLVDAMVGDPTLYTRQDMVEASWAAVQPILDYRERHPPSTFRTTRPEPGDRRRRTRCWRAAGHTWRSPEWSKLPVRPERISKDLRKLWVDLGKTSRAGVLRACAMTLDRGRRGGARCIGHWRDDRLSDARASEPGDPDARAGLRG